MDTSKLVPRDPRVREETAQVRGKTYSYILGEPKDKPAAAIDIDIDIDTIFLLHGFPDLSFGWRHQIPYFVSLGFRVVAPNMLGYAGTSRPDDLGQFSLRSMSDDIRELAVRFVGEQGQIIVGGHDWGGSLAWRLPLWHPELVKAVFSVCTPFMPPSPKWLALEDHIAAGRIANFKYQLQLAGPEVEQRLRSEQQIWRFLNGMFGGRGPGGEVAFTTADGVQFDNLDRLGPSPMVSGVEVDYYAEQYMLQAAPPLRGPLNWYRTRRINFEDELELAATFKQIGQPALFIAASRDAALPPSMSAGMERFFSNLSRVNVDATHWALVEASGEVNARVTEWLGKVLNRNIRSVL